MTRFPDSPWLYAILTDPRPGWERMTDILVEESVPVIQLRMKHAPREAVLEMARRLRPRIPPSTRFIVNDDPWIAMEAGADGVHLGQDDMPVPHARNLLGEGPLIGLSTHNADQLRRAAALRPDYVGVGPVFPTRTKDRPDPVLGLDETRRLLASTALPTVCIGGIHLGNLPQVLGAGARGVAMVSHIQQAEDPRAAVRAVQQRMAQDRPDLS